MSDFRDPELENILGRLSGAYPDANSAYVAVAGRVRQVKRRRAFVASAAACVALFGVGALAVSGGNGAQKLQPASEASSKSSTESSSASSAETSVEDTESPSSDPTMSSVDASSSSEPNTSVSTPNSNSGGGTTTPGKGTTPSSGTSNSGTSNSGTSNSGTSNSGTSNSGSSQPAVTAPSGNTTYPSDGGSITVSLANGQLSLVSAAPMPGFSETVKHDRADRVEVEFSDGSVVWRIRVDLQNGQLSVQTTPN